MLQFSNFFLHVGRGEYRSLKLDFKSASNGWAIRELERIVELAHPDGRYMPSYFYALAACKVRAEMRFGKATSAPRMLRSQRLATASAHTCTPFKYA